MRSKKMFYIIVTLFIMIVILFVACLCRYDYIDLNAFADPEKIEETFETKKDPYIIDGKPDDTFENDDNKNITEPEIVPIDNENKGEEKSATENQIKIGYFETIGETGAALTANVNDEFKAVFRYGKETFALVYFDQALSGYAEEKSYAIIKIDGTNMEYVCATKAGEMAFDGSYYLPSGIIFVFSEMGQIKLYMFNGYNFPLMNTLNCEKIYEIIATESGYTVFAERNSNLLVLNLNYDMSVFNRSTVGLNDNGYVGNFEMNGYRYILTAGRDNGTIYELYGGVYISNTYSTVPFDNFAIRYHDGKFYLCLIQNAEIGITMTFYDNSFVRHGTYTQTGVALNDIISVKGQIYVMGQFEDALIAYGFRGFGLETDRTYYDCGQAKRIYVYGADVYYETDGDIGILTDTGCKKVYAGNTKYALFEPTSNLILSTEKRDGFSRLVIQRF